MIRVSEELLHDSAFDLAAYIAGEFARRVGAELGVTAASAVAITADELIDLQHSVKSGYRRKGLWIMNDATLKLLRKLKDGQGNFIWQLGLLAGQPDTLLNQKVMISNYMPLATRPSCTAISAITGWRIARAALCSAWTSCTPRRIRLASRSPSV